MNELHNYCAINKNQDFEINNYNNKYFQIDRLLYMLIFDNL